MSSWEIYLFGSPRIERDDRSVSISRRKTVALLVYLAVEPRPHSRETLAALMWPEHTAVEAKANLRRDLYRLKNILSEDVLRIDRNQAMLDPNEVWWLDVQIFQQHIQLLRDHNHFPEQYCAQCLQAGQEAVQLYAADFMAGFTLPDSPEFDEWQFFQRESLRQSLAELLQRLLDWHTRQDEYEQAIEYGRRRLAMDTLYEPAHRELMRLYAWAGQHAAAIRQYEECLRLLDEELGVSPEPETTHLYEAIFARKLPAPVVEKAAVQEPAAPVPTGARYEIGELLAEGGHGEVYLGRDQLTGDTVVIKRIKPELITPESEFLTRFRQEGEILSRLNHPNIVRMLDTFHHQGQYHIVIEYVPGGSLRQRLKSGAPLEPAQAIAVALELADALGRAHHLGIIHRDLKPENILIADDGTPRLTDFGVAHLKRQEGRLTRTGAILGSPNYISPEIIQDGEIDGRSDIWSLGVVLYEMLTGRTPFGGGQIVTTLFNIINESEPSLLDIRPDLPLPLVNLVHNMLKKEPAQRPASMRQVAAVLEAIREGRSPKLPPTYFTPTTGPQAPIVHKATPTPIPTPHFLPHQPNSFVGREEELAQIRRLLVEEESCRLLTLVGPEGIGKTRLAVEAAARLLDAFPGGVYFVPLASVTLAELIIPAIGESLRLQFAGPDTPKAQLIRQLPPEKLLLVADHLEQSLEGGRIVSRLLQLAPNLTFLVTLGERLQLTEEWSYELSGLTLPETAAVTDQAALERYSATQLFIKRARQARADFSLRDEDLAHIIEICSLLNCSPLGIELAAPWVRSLSLGEIATGIKEAINRLAASANGSGSYLSLKAVFSQSWAALPTAEQETLRRLSVFRGGCTHDAAAEVTGASIQTLNALMDKALIRHSSNGRYELHPLVRQFAAEQLQSDPEENELIYDLHGRYFLLILDQQTPALKSDREKHVLAEMAADRDNLLAAWKWGVDHCLLEDLSAAAQGYWLFHQFRGRLYEGETTFRQAAERLINAADSAPDSLAVEQLAGFLKAAQGDMMARRDRLVEGINEIEIGLELMGQGEGFDPEIASFALTALAAAQLALGQFETARQTAEESLERLPRRGDLWIRAVCLQLLGSAALRQGRLDTAEDFFRDCLDICNQLNEQRLRIKAKIGLSYIARLRGSYGRAQRWLDEALELNRSLNDRLTQADLLREQGILALERGQFDRAITLLEESQAISDAIGRNDSGLTDSNLGRYYHQQGQLDRADTLYRLGLAAAKAAEYDPGIAYSLLQIGSLALDRGRLNQAEQYLQDALAISQEIENEAMMAEALQSLGSTAVQMGEARAADARAYFRQSLQLAVKHRLAPTGLKAALGLVPLLVRSGEIHQALRLLILTEQHPAGSYQVKRATQKVLDTLPKDEVTAVRRESISLDWVETAGKLIEELATATWGQPPIHHNLPVHRSTFFGRRNELADIQKYLLEAKSRLVSIIGPGGIGKTRLGIAVGAALAPHFPQGVFLVPLAPLETADQILNTLADILGIQNLVADNPRQQLLKYLKRKQMLLIFDNYEQLLPQVDLIADIIETAPNVQMIVTTRQRLNLGAELVYTLKGMTYPASAEAAPEKLAAYDAVQLLVEHAQMVRPEAPLQPEAYKQIVRICHLVQGMPLALVLAANWLDMLSFAEIADEIAESLDFLESERGDLPARQRSVRAVFNGSWSRLPPGAQETFARLSVFRGGFTREAATAVCKTSLRDLRTLINSSFVTVSAGGRYEVHELMRQLGAEQLAARGTAETTQNDHSNYYLALLKKREADLKGQGQIEALEEIIEDFDNIRSAWNWALKRGNRQAIDQGQECLHLFFDIQGRYAEGRSFFSRAKKALVPPPGEKGDAVFGRILTRRAFLGTLIGRPKASILADLEQGAAIAHENEDEFEIALNLMARSTLLENPQTDLERFHQARTIFEELHDDFYLTRVCVSLANCYGTLLALQKTKYFIEEAARIARSTGSVLNLGIALGNLAEIELAFGQYDLAQAYLEESLALGQKMHAWLLIAYCHTMLGFNRLLLGDLSEGETGGRKGLAQAEEIEYGYLKAFSLAILSIWAGLTGQTDLGKKWAEESQAISENNIIGLVLTPWGLAINYFRLGRWEEAGKALANAFLQAEAQQLPAPLVWLMPVAALIAVEKGQPLTAVRCLSIAKNHPYRATGWMAAWSRLAGLEAELKQQLDQEFYEAAWAEGVNYCEGDMLPPSLLTEIYNVLDPA